MDLSVKVQTGIKDLIIDFIEVINKKGKSFSLNWNESLVRRTEDGFVANYYDVNFEKQVAPNKFDDLDGMKVSIVGLYSEEEKPLDIGIKKMRFEVETPRGKIDKKIFSDVYQTADNDQETTFRDRLISFVEERAKGALQELWQAVKRHDDSTLEQFAYDMKSEIFHGTINPFTRKERRNKDYFLIFDDWYDCLVADVLVPTLKRAVRESRNKKGTRRQYYA